MTEALRFGKKIIGTPEAFSGYDDVANRTGWVCATADELVAAIEQAADADVNPFDLELRALDEEKYSFSAARSRLAGILGEGAADPGHPDSTPEQESIGGS